VRASRLSEPGLGLDEFGDAAISDGRAHLSITAQELQRIPQDVAKTQAVCLEYENDLRGPRNYRSVEAWGSLGWQNGTSS
jgi:hypothetical protein